MPDKPRQRALSLRTQLVAMERAKNAEERKANALLDVLNALLLREGGRMVIAEPYWVAARRHEIVLDYLAGGGILVTTLPTAAAALAGQKMPRDVGQNGEQDADHGDTAIGA